MFLFTYSVCFICLIGIDVSLSEEVCYKDVENCQTEEARYLFYDVFPMEGFNLRRDVYMRMAILAHKLQKSNDPHLNKVKLVLPPWHRLVHWHNSNGAKFIPWSTYFDLPSLKLFAPVIELYEFFENVKNKYSSVNIEQVYVLQTYDDMFETGKFEDKWEYDNCKKDTKILSTDIYFYKNLTANNTQCVSFHGTASKLIEILKDSKASTILFDQAQTVLHDYFGNAEYWRARRSMRFNKELLEIAADYRRFYLNSDDESDNTKLPDDWRDEKPGREAIGGPYIAVHMRRNDFVRSRPNETPNMKYVSKQIINLLKRLDLDTVFVASDTDPTEFSELEKLILTPYPRYKVYRYVPSLHVRKVYKDGGTAIIDQIICSRARFFVGTKESTFTYRIREEREILGFPKRTTFNCLCHRFSVCEDTMWEIMY